MSTRRGPPSITKPAIMTSPPVPTLPRVEMLTIFPVPKAPVWAAEPTTLKLSKITRSPPLSAD